MESTFEGIEIEDYIVIAGYFIFVLAVGLYVSLQKFVSCMPLIEFRKSKMENFCLVVIMEEQKRLNRRIFHGLQKHALDTSGRITIRQQHRVRPFYRPGRHRCGIGNRNSSF